MKLFDMGIGAALIIAALLFGAHTVGKQYLPQYSAAVDSVKVKVQPYTDKAKAVYDDAVAAIEEFEMDYIDPYRTPTDGIDNPVWQPKD